MKPFTNLAIALLGAALCFACCMIVQQQRQISELLRNQAVVGADAASYQVLYEDAQAQLARQKQVNAHYERWHSEAARGSRGQDPFKPVAAAATDGDCLLPPPVVKK